MKKQIVGTILSIATIGGLSATANAEQPNALVFGKLTAQCGVIFVSGSGHWSSTFNPSGVNQILRDGDCGAPITVIAGTPRP
jgi:hypothetical protein